MATALEEIPSPPGLPILGNAYGIDSETPTKSFRAFADQYGPIYKLNLAGRILVVVSSQALVNECCDERRFGKYIKPPLSHIRDAVHDGLFTAELSEPNWSIAHRVLMPAFGPISIQGMFNQMHDIASQLTMKWARHGPSTPIMVTDDFTRLTLDTLALCAMDYRFNSFYHDDMHPFIQAMGAFLAEAGSRSRRPPCSSIFYRETDRKYHENINIMRRTADEVLQERKEKNGKKNDLLGAMLEGVDAKTGKRMTDASITDNLITFLVAGHETTSGLLSFAFYQLIKHPEAYRKVQQEVDEVIGTDPIKAAHLPRLRYIAAVLRETLRLTPTIPGIIVSSHEEDILGGRYNIPKNQSILLLLAKSQADPMVFGTDADVFCPERMLDGNFDSLNNAFPNFWKPFGNGVRSCIGRPFAWQESLLVMAMLMQNFDFVMDDPNYQLDIKQTLTIKPKDFYMRAMPRGNLNPITIEHRLAGTQKPTEGKSGIEINGVTIERPNGIEKPLSIFYGSNSGTCEALAYRLASDASGYGFRATTVCSLDAVCHKLPTDQPVAIITASYEGQPPDNASLFVKWLESMNDKDLGEVSYAVFGCGHRDWFQTLHRIPKLVDAKLEDLGASRIAFLGLTDTAEGNTLSDFEMWEDEVFWPDMSQRYGVAQAVEAIPGPSLSVKLSTLRSSTLQRDMQEANVVHAHDLCAPGAAPKKHLEVQLPSGMSYQTGDYLNVLPTNPKETVARVMRRFQLTWDAHVTIMSDGRTSLPTNIPIPASYILEVYVELESPATKKGISVLAEATEDVSIKSTLQKLSGEDFQREISSKKVSIFSLLMRFPTIDLPFGTFLALLQPMRVRQYSISSSHLWNSSHATLTYSVLNAPHSDPAQKQPYLGVASTYLSTLTKGDKLLVCVRPSRASFHLPKDMASTPVLCVAAGTGLAPFRGFFQERAVKAAAGIQLAPALLFFGCREPGMDDIYRNELDEWQRQGLVTVRRAYSRKPGHADAKGCKYVQDRLWLDRAEVENLWCQGAKAYVCGSRRLGDAVKEKSIVIKMGSAERRGIALNREKTEEWFRAIQNDRYATDIFD